MATAYTPILQLALPVTGELQGTWGTVVNDNITSMIEQAIAGLATVSTWTAASHTLTTANGTTDEARCAVLECSGAPGAAATVVCPALSKVYVIKNSVTGGYAVTLKTSAGTGISVPNGSTALLYCDGTNVVSGATYMATLSTTQVDILAQGDLRLQDTTGGEYVALQAPATIATSYTLTLPTDDGTAGQALVTDGSGVLSWSTAASGDVYGPASATDNAIARFDLTTGKLIQNSVVTIADTTGNMAGVGTLSSGAITSSSLTSSRVLYAGTSGLIQDSANMTFNGTNLTLANDATISGQTVGKGGGAVASNTAHGAGALAVNTTGAFNTAIGAGAGQAITTGNYLTAVGRDALLTATGDANTGIGVYAARQTTTGTQNTALGYFSLKDNTTGSNNTALGNQSLQVSAASNNTAVGYQAGNTLTTGSNNLILGYQAAVSAVGVSNEITLGNSSVTSLRIPGLSITAAASALTIGSQFAVTNTASAVNYLNATGAVTTGAPVISAAGSDTNIGITLTPKGTGVVTSSSDALVNGITIGKGGGAVATNTAVGLSALTSNTSGANNTAFGYQALNGNTTLSSSVGVGYQALYTGGGGQSTAIGWKALFAETTAGGGNVAVGYGAATAITGGAYNVAIGFQSLNKQLAANYSTAIGYQALFNTTAGGNLAIGYKSAFANTTGTGNSAIGYSALQANTTGSNNTAVGDSALKTNLTGNNNSAFGVETLKVNTGTNNSGFGMFALTANTTGTYNSSFGSYSLYKTTTGNYNTAVGSALYNNVTGTQNTGIGHNALDGVTGSNNTSLGSGAGLTLTTGSNNTLIGYNAAPSVVTVSNEFTLGDTNVTSFRIPALTITAGAKWINVGSSTVALLPAAATAGLGARAFVTNALTPAFGSAVVGGGAVAVPVYSDGTSWLVG